jgi:adenylate cyclase
LVSTGLGALDGLLGRGYPSRSAILIEGPSGNEKGCIAYKFLKSGLDAEDVCVYVSRVPSSEVIEDANAFGIDLNSKKLAWMCSEGSQSSFSSNNLASLSFNIKEIMKTNQYNRLRIVFDLLSQLLMMHSGEDVYKFVSQLLAEIKKHDAVILATIEERMHQEPVLAAMELAFDGVLVLRPKSDGNVEIQVKKMRGLRLSSPTIEVWLSPPKKNEFQSVNKKRIAILPFSNISEDPHDEYFADGLTEELISTMSKISGVQVIARTSVMQYKEGKKSIDEIGKELKVSTILEGSVRKADNKLRITAQLIDCQDSHHLWSQTYDREFKEIFVIQTDISNNVADALKIRFLPSERERIRKDPTKDLEAYNLYMQGIFQSSKVTPEGFAAAIELYRKAIILDPRFALGYAAMSDCYRYLETFGMAPASEAATRARESAEKALQYDETLPEAHLSLGNVLANVWDYDAAKSEFQKAIELNPSSASAHAYLGYLLLPLGAKDEAVAHFRLALELDPFSAVNLTYVGVGFLAAGSFYDESIDILSKALKIDGNITLARESLGIAYVCKKDFDIGIPLIEEAVRLSGENDPGKLGDLGWAYVRSGQSERAIKILARLFELEKQNPWCAYSIAGLYASLSKTDLAFEWLEKAYEQRLSALRFIETDLVFENLLSDPRFHQLLAKIGLTK